MDRQLQEPATAYIPENRRRAQVFVKLCAYLRFLRDKFSSRGSRRSSATRASLSCVVGSDPSNSNWHTNLKSQISLLLFACLTTLTSCHSTEPLDKKVIGKWTMEKVYEYDQDVTAKHNPSNNRYFKFNQDGTFMSDGDPFGRNTGRWKVDNETAILFIDSDVEDDDSEWHITFKDDKTIWTGIGHPRKENTRLVHKKSFD